MKNTPYLDKPLRPLVEVETLREDRLAEEGMRVETDPFAKAAPRPWIPIARYASLLTAGRDTDGEPFVIARMQGIRGDPGPSSYTTPTRTQALANQALIYAAVNAYGQPTDLERELTAALRDVLSAWEAKSGFGTVYEMQRAIPDARRVLAKATERGL